MPLFVIATVKDLDNFYDDIKNKIPKELDRPGRCSWLLWLLPSGG